MGRLKLLLGTLIVFMPLSGFASGDYLGEKECYSCHKDIKKVYLKDIHGKIFTKNPRNSLEAHSCEACHGPGSAHKVAADKADKGEKVPLDVEYPFTKGDEFDEQNNARCLTCHEKGANTHWQGNQHEMADVGCVDCHMIHSEEEIDGTAVCGNCHVQKRAQLQRSSHLPMRESKISCSDCHNPHGSMGPGMLKQSSVNENCYACHAEKRGPMVWEHGPVRDDCTICHDPHGANHDAMLKMRVPFLCQSCHAMQFHPSAIYEGNELQAYDKHFVVKGCLNCHSLVHGSNHPSGSRFTR